MKTVILAIAFVACAGAQDPMPFPDVTIDLKGGAATVSEIFFVSISRYDHKPWPRVRFGVAMDRAGMDWQLTLGFEADGTCDGKPTHWSFTRLVYVTPARPTFTNSTVTDLIDALSSCRSAYTDKIKVSLVRAENKDLLFKASDGIWVDLKAQRAARDAALAAEKTAQDAMAQKEQDEADAQQAARQAALRARCHAVYRQTANRKVSDLTVVETQRVKACQQLDMYE